MDPDLETLATYMEELKASDGERVAISVQPVSDLGLYAGWKVLVATRIDGTPTLQRTLIAPDGSMSTTIEAPELLTEDEQRIYYLYITGHLPS